MATPLVLDEFINSIAKFQNARDAQKLQSYLKVEPPLPNHYEYLSKELKASWRDSKRLEKHIENIIPLNDDPFSVNEGEGGVAQSFLDFVKEYLEFWRDVDFSDLVATHSQLNTLANSCITVLSHVSWGIIALPTTIQLCAALAKLATMLDKRPDLTQGLRKIQDEGEGRKTLVEGTAESIQRAFTICLSAKTSSPSGVGRDGKPEGKKAGIYSFANMVLRLLFQCRKTGLANQLFTNIAQNAPTLRSYPASQRVTYSYFLGRYHFNNSHFYHAQRCLQYAYDECHVRCTKQREIILIYLMSSNMILGRFPSEDFRAREEAKNILDKFLPIAQAIRTGNMVAFKHALGPESGNAQWFFQKGVLLQLLSRCEVLVWRSLARRVFLLTFQSPTNPTSRKAPTLDLVDMVAAAQYCQKLLMGWHKPVDTMALMQSGRTHPNSMFMKPTGLIPPSQPLKSCGPQRGMIFGNKMPDMFEIEAIIASLAQQGLMHGYVSHSLSKFAIIGAKQRGGPLCAGFPNVWQIIKARAESEGQETDTPGWVQREKKGMGGVINLSGIARPVGSGG